MVKTFQETTGDTDQVNTRNNGVPNFGGVARSADVACADVACADYAISPGGVNMGQCGWEEMQ